MSHEFLNIAWRTRFANLGEKLVLLAVADGTNNKGKVRIDPVEAAPHIGIPASRVDAALAELVRAGLIEGRRWDDTGAWSISMHGAHTCSKEGQNDE